MRATTDTLGVTRQARPRKRPTAAAQAGLARVDPLTGLPNKQVWMEALETERVRRARYRRPVVVMNVDIDGLKETNLRYGREAGDELLCGAANVLRRNLRDSDLVARIDEDEFGVLMPETYGDAMDAVVSRLYGAAALWRGTNPELRLSVSIGWAAPEPFGDLRETQRAASEERLQQAQDRA